VNECLDCLCWSALTVSRSDIHSFCVSIYCSDDEDEYIVGVRIDGVEILQNRAKNEYRHEILRWIGQQSVQRHFNFDE